MRRRILLARIEHADRPQLTYTLVKKRERLVFYLNVGKRKVRVASISARYSDDVLSYALKLAGQANDGRIVLSEEAGDRLFLYIRVRPLISEDRALNLKRTLSRLEPVELWFWAWKMREEPMRAASAFMRLYGV